MLPETSNGGLLSTNLSCAEKIDTKVNKNGERSYRSLCPRINGPKLYKLLSDDSGKEITRDRDSFLRFYSEKNFRLPRNKPIHTTNSNHVYRKYANLDHQEWFYDSYHLNETGAAVYCNTIAEELKQNKIVK